MDFELIIVGLLIVAFGTVIGFGLIYAVRRAKGGF